MAAIYTTTGDATYTGSGWYSNGTADDTCLDTNYVVIVCDEAPTTHDLKVDPETWKWLQSREASRAAIPRIPENWEVPNYGWTPRRLSVRRNDKLCGREWTGQNFKKVT